MATGSSSSMRPQGWQAGCVRIRSRGEHHALQGRSFGAGYNLAYLDFGASGPSRGLWHRALAVHATTATSAQR